MYVPPIYRCMESTTINYDRVPSHMQDGIRAYVETGRHPGGFLKAVLSNELVQAFNAADSTNRRYMDEWAAFLFNELPANCWGSRETVDEWVDQGGLEGL